MGAIYDAAANDQNQRIATVAKLKFTTPIYLTTHQISGITGTVFSGVLIPNTSISQKLNPDDSRAEIGSISFEILDDGTITTEFKNKLDADEGLKDVTIELCRGGLDDDFSEYQLIQTQIITGVVHQAGKYRVQCSDVQRSMKKTIFDPAVTEITQTVAVDDTTINVVSTANFEPCPHTSSFTDKPGQSVYYFMLKKGDDFEIMSATGKTATSFTGVTRGLFHTTPLEFVFDGSEGAKNAIKVTEYIYLEMPVPAMIYALLTGQIINGGTLPSNWHLGIDPSWIDLNSFQNVGADWFNPNDYTKGLIYRFNGLKKQEGKAFIESELLKLVAFMPIGADGRLRLKRIAGVVSTASAKTELNESNIVRYSDLTHDLKSVYNVIDLKWGYIETPRQGKGFTRQDIFIDQGSITRNNGRHVKSVSMLGLHNARHTRSSIKSLFDAFRDRYTNPPLKLKLTLLPTVHDLQVGDIVTVNLPQLKDMNTGQGLNRSFEVQRVSTNLVTGAVQVDLFGSTGNVDSTTDDDASDTAELPDGWYSTKGTNASSILSIDASGFLTADGTLTGGATNRTWFYYLGDLTIPAGRTLTIQENVGLAVRGHLQIEGAVKVESATGGNPGFVGTTVSGSGLVIGGPSIVPRVVPAERKVITGLNDTLPPLNVTNNAGAIEGVPEDMRGTNGDTGGDVFEWNGVDQSYENKATGGSGGAGGGSVVFVSRGAGMGASGLIDLSGKDGAAGAVMFGAYQGGSGAGGAPGCALFLIDGNLNAYPLLIGKVRAQYGFSPTPTAQNSGRAGKANQVIDVGLANARVLYVPASSTPYPDYGIDQEGGQNKGTAIFKSSTAPTNATCQKYYKRNLLPGDEWLNTSSTPYVPHEWDGTQWIPDKKGGKWSNVIDDNGDLANLRAQAAQSAADAQQALSDAANAQSTADGKIESFFQTAAPTSGMTTGDLWFDTDDGNKIYRYDGAQWVAAQDSQIGQAILSAQTAQSTADGKAKVFYQAGAPTGHSLGDMWVDTDDNNKLYVSNGSAWILAQDYYTASQMADWSQVTDDNGLRPADGATSGSYLNKNPFFDPNIKGWSKDWAVFNDITNDTEFTYQTRSDSPSGGNTVLVGQSADDSGDVLYSNKFDIEPNKTYRVVAWVRQPAGNKRNYLLVGFIDADGNIINSLSTPATDAQGWAATGTFNFFGVINQPFPASWTRYELVFGKNQPVTIPSRAVRAVVGALLMRDAGTTASTVEIAEISIREDTALVWSGIIDDDGNRPEPGATAGADWRTNITNRPSNAQLLNNLLEIDKWTPGTNGSQGRFSRNGADDENNIILDISPFGNHEPIWRCHTNSSANSDADGGWDYYFYDTDGYDPKKTYMFLVWAKQTGTNGTVYMGCSTCLNYDDSTNSNPYWFASDLPTLNEWYLIVGVLQGEGAPKINSNLSGVWNPRTGERVYGSYDFWSNGSTAQRHRAYWYYSADTTHYVYFARPGVYAMDGTEPDILSMLRSTRSYNRTARLTDQGRPNDQRFYRANLMMFNNAALSGAIITSSDAGSTATITISSSTLYTDIGAIAYNSGSITGRSFSTKYYIYTVDPDLNGGAVTYYATTNFTTIATNADYVYFGAVTTVNNGGGGGGSEPPCVAVDQYLPDAGIAGNAQTGTPLIVLREDLLGIEQYEVKSVEFSPAECVRITTESGIDLVCSIYTPLTLADGREINVCDGFNKLAPVLDNGEFRWERITQIKNVGTREVAHIHCDSRTYAAGSEKGRYILTHNPVKP